MTREFNAAWGPDGYRARVQQAMQQPDFAKAVAEVELKARLAETLFAWPAKRLVAIEQARAERPSVRRGGY